VADPLSDGLLKLLDTTARVNREVFTELFRPSTEQSGCTIGKLMM